MTVLFHKYSFNFPFKWIKFIDHFPFSRPYATPSVTWYPHTYTHHPYQYQSHIGSTQRPWTGQITPSTTPTPPPTTTMPILMEWQLRSMAERKRAIFVRIGLDSSATVISIILFIISICSKILLALLILLNLIFVFRLKKLMKNANLCQNDYRNFLFKNLDDEKIAKYSNSSLVGFFKFAHWVIFSIHLIHLIYKILVYSNFGHSPLHILHSQHLPMDLHFLCFSLFLCKLD